MQNRSALWIFSILLGLACLYQISFSFFTGRVEKKARAEAQIQTDSVLAVPRNAGADRDSVLLVYENKYLRAHDDDQIYPVLKFTYGECKEKEINMGLDLKGGMAVTLEVSIPELIENLSGNSDDPQFTTAIRNARQRQSASDKDFITLFSEEWDKLGADRKLAAVFHTQDNEKKFSRDATNAQIIDALKEEAAVAINNTERILRTRIDKFGVSQPSIQKQQFTGRIQIELPGVKDKERVRKVLQSTANLEFWETYDNREIGPVLDKVNLPLGAFLHPEMAKADSAVADSATAVADTLGTTVPSDTATAAADTSSADTTLADETDEGPVDSAAMRAENEKKYPLATRMAPIINQQRAFVKGPAVGQALLADTADINMMLGTSVVRSALPGDCKLLWGSKPDQGTNVITLYAIRVPKGTGGKPKLDGSAIIDASQDFDFKGDVEVKMQMNAEGAQIWRVMTADNVDKSIAIVLDDLVQSAPNVTEEIPSGNSSITLGGGDMNKQIQEAEDLSNILKAGALPAPARIIDETVVGPTLGAENVNSGLLSFAISLVGVLLVMGLYYARAGWIADIALLANVFFLIGSMASLQATLTLPGIAGIVLTVGMAVDANVLINERVREELKLGKMLKSAVDIGFSNQGALSAIIDSNVTTFATGVILFLFGSGPIKGFATTLMIGIATSLFTAIFISRLVMTRRLEKGKTISFWTGWSKNVFANARYDFMGKRKIFYIFSAIIIGVGIWSMATRGFNLGVDFSGGRAYVVRFDQDQNVDDVRNALSPLFVGEEGREYTTAVKTYGGARQLKITTNYLIDQLGTETDVVVDARLREGLDKIGVKYSVQESRKVDATISDDIKAKAVTSVVLALVFMFIYIAIRFNKWQYGFGALLSLVHDTLFVLGLYSLLWGRVGFSLEIDEAFIAVILTVIGYSINDTVVVFDRIREYVRDHKREPVVTVFNKAINSTLSRTLNTGFCTMLVLLIIFFMGAVSIKGFVFGLFAGILTGTYSSIFVASAAAVELLKNRKEEKAKVASVAAA